ncbi:hypothetical protein HYQ46_011244 [Verticillium longisporum]|nr:hypothetical protein HYQ46_011244 [Verticillium longisporum]
MNDKEGPTQVSCLALGFEDHRQHVDLILSRIHAPDPPMHSTTTISSTICTSSTITTLIRFDANSSRAAPASACLEACEALSIQGRTTIIQDYY